MPLTNDLAVFAGGAAGINTGGFMSGLLKATNHYKPIRQTNK
jgi:hypothetical protein